MQRTLYFLTILFIPLFGATGCSWLSTANVDYGMYNAYTDKPDGAYQQKGRVFEDGWAHYTGMCGTAAEYALADAIESARAMGANALANVKWVDPGDEQEYETPHCQSSFYIYYWGSRSQVAASAVFVEDLKTANWEPSTFPIAVGDSHDLAQSFLTQMRSGL
jgi:hypothetical protein